MALIHFVQNLNTVTHGLLYLLAVPVGLYLLTLLRHSAIGKKLANAEILLTKDIKALVGEKTYEEAKTIVEGVIVDGVAKYLGLPVSRIIGMATVIFKDLFPAPAPAPTPEPSPTPSPTPAAK